MTNYKAMTDEEQRNALFAHSINLQRLKRRRKAIKDSPSDSQTAAEWDRELKDIGQQMRQVNAELKSFWQQVMAT